MPLDTFKKPDISKMSRNEPKDPNAKPKRLFKFGAGAGSSAFQQQMREQMMSGAKEKAPKKVDAN